MKYTLTKYDVLKLYPEMTPIEIKKEFGDRRPSIKQLYNITNKVADKSACKKRQERKMRWIEKRPPQLTTQEVSSMVGEYSDWIKQVEVKRIWEEINHFEGRF